MLFHHDPSTTVFVHYESTTSRQQEEIIDSRMFPTSDHLEESVRTATLGAVAGPSFSTSTDANKAALEYC